jgi:hypothetical protein
MPTEIDVKLANDLAEFRLETEKRFGSVEKGLAAIDRDLKFIRWIGVFFAGVLVAVVFGAGRVIWDASALHSKVEQQGQRLEKVEGRLDAMDRKLDTLLSRTAPAPKPGG